MNPDTTVYIPVPVSEKPEKDGSYWVLKSDDHPLDQFRSTETFECGSWNYSGEKVVAWLKPTLLSEITTSQPLKTNEDILGMVEALEYVINYCGEQYPQCTKVCEEALSSYRTSGKPLCELTDPDALEIFYILGMGPSISDEAKIHQVKDLIATNKIYNTQTNIPGMGWYKIFQFLLSKGYQIK